MPIPNHDFVFGPAGQPLGLGSARFLSNAMQPGALETLYTPQYALTRLADITTLKYKTYVDGTSLDPNNALRFSSMLILTLLTLVLLPTHGRDG